MHNIEDELIFQSNDKLVFHDSRGFEAGSEDEFQQLKQFIADRAKTTFLKKRIHAIWYIFKSGVGSGRRLVITLYRYCIPMDKLDRCRYANGA